MISYNHPVPNSFGIGCLAARYVEFASVEELEQSLAGAAEPFLFVGEGSNLLFTGDRFEGTVFHNGMKDIEILQDDGDDVVVKVGGGYIWDEFVSFAVANGWHGAENLSLIPGQVGSAAVQNIGAYGAEVKDILVSVETFDIRSRLLRVFDNAGCGFGYRRSFFKTPEGSGNIVLSVTFSLSRKSAFNLEYGNLRQYLPAGADISLSDVRGAVIAARQSKLPDVAEYGSAGSFFVNPVVTGEQCAGLLSQWPGMPHYPAENGFAKLSAAWLIDQCGWKGRSVGRAGVWHLQPLVLVNLGGAEGREILELSREVQDSVREKFGVELSPEVRII